jgi:hypothetical protein
LKKEVLAGSTVQEVQGRQKAHLKRAVRYVQPKANL